MSEIGDKGEDGAGGGYAERKHALWERTTVGKRIARLVGGWALIALGLIGCLVPIMPGIPFLLGGLALLAVDYPWAKRWLDWMKDRIARLRGRRSSVTR